MNGRQHFLYINVSDDPNDTSKKTAKWISSACLQFSPLWALSHVSPFHTCPNANEHWTHAFYSMFVRCSVIRMRNVFNKFYDFIHGTQTHSYTDRHKHEELIFCKLHLLLLKCRKWDGYEFVLGHNRLSRRHIRLQLALHPLRCLLPSTAAAKPSERTYSFRHRHRAWGLCVCSVGSSSY